MNIGKEERKRVKGEREKKKPLRTYLHNLNNVIFVIMQNYHVVGTQ